MTGFELLNYNNRLITEPLPVDFLQKGLGKIQDILV